MNGPNVTWDKLTVEERERLTPAQREKLQGTAAPADDDVDLDDVVEFTGGNDPAPDLYVEGDELPPAPAVEGEESGEELDGDVEDDESGAAVEPGVGTVVTLDVPNDDTVAPASDSFNVRAGNVATLTLGTPVIEDVPAEPTP